MNNLDSPNLVVSMEQEFEPAKYPMGPNVRRLLGLEDSDYRGHLAPQPLPDLQRLFGGVLDAAIEEAELPSSLALLDLLEELVAMDYPAHALRLADLNPNLLPADDPAGLMAIGNAAMLTGDMARAEICIRDAQALDPEEPAAYVNLLQILYQDARFEEAKEWCDAGLSVSPNHRKLWEYFADLLKRANQESAPDELRNRAEALNSWAGLSLACEMQMPGDARLQAEILGRLYEEGERSLEFLTEYTAALGGAEQYDRIPSIVLQAERFAVTAMPWQLIAHSLQAHLARGVLAPAASDFQKLQALGSVPDHVVKAFEQVIADFEHHHLDHLQ